MIIRLVSVVDWSEEKECMDTVCKEIAMFNLINNSKKKFRCGWIIRSGKEKIPKKNWCIEHLIYKALKNVLLFSKENTKNYKFKLVDLAALYRVFERW